MKKNKQSLYILTWVLLFIIGGLLATSAGFYLYLSPQLPSVESLRDIRFQTPLRIYTSDKKLIGEFGEKRRTPIKRAEIPETYVKAILAAEDDQFYYHNGVSIKGLIRATTELISTGSIQSGGSTITMQVARNFFLSRRQTFARKFNEILLALKIERELSKDEILELYVNVIFLGKRAYGIHAAAEVYYGKSLNELNLAQLAMIAGIPKGPSIYNPIADPERAIKRRNWILGRMRSLDFITEENYQLARSEPVTAVYHSARVAVDAPYVAEMARKETIERFGLDAYTNGYQIYTTIDSGMQEEAQSAVVRGLIAYDTRHGYKGPEHQLISENRNSQEDKLIDELTDHTIEQWQEYLRQVPTYGALVPAAVVRVSEKDFTAIFANGERATIFWDNGLSSARSYISENSRGPKPESAQDVVSIGDVVRLRFEGGKGWILSQIPEAQAAMVALSPKNGAILSLVGGFDFRHSHFNRATQANRQPGSNFKPFIYTAALENGMTPASIVNDAPIVFDDDLLEGTWRPENDSGKFYGNTRLRKALYLSRNLVSIRVLRQIGIGNAIRTLKKFGFDSEALPKDLSLSLGSHAVTPLEVARGYTLFANGGYLVDPFLVEQVRDTEGNIIYQALPKTVCVDCEDKENGDQDLLEITPDDLITEENFDQHFDDIEDPSDFIFKPFELNYQVKKLIGLLEPEDFPRAPKMLDDQISFIINDMLKDVITRGTGKRARSLGRNDLAGKTGTTNGPTDAWFSGYQKDIVATTWVGFDQNSPLGKGEYGGSAALPIWIEFMKNALRGVPIYSPKQPSGVVMVRIDPETGERARTEDPDAIFEIFREQNVPELTETDIKDPYSNDELLQEELF